MQTRKRFNLRAVSQRFNNDRKDFGAILSMISRRGDNVVKELCRIVEEGTEQQKFDLVFFLNFFCYGSPRNLRLLEFRLKGHESVLQRLQERGLKTHGQQCCNRSEVSSLKKALILVKEKLFQIETAIDAQLKEGRR